MSAGTRRPDGAVIPRSSRPCASSASTSPSGPQRLTHELAEQADVVVTMGCGDACPYIPGKRYVDWDLPDPKGRPLDEVRAIRDDIARRVKDLVQQLT